MGNRNSKSVGRIVLRFAAIVGVALPLFGAAPTLAGTYELTIGEATVDASGKNKTALAINESLNAVDTDRWVVQRSATGGTNPEHVVLSTDGKSLYVDSVENGAVSVIEIGKRNAVRTIPIGSMLHGIDISGDSRTQFVAALDDEKVFAFDLATCTYRSARVAPADEQKLWVFDQEDLEMIGDIPMGGKVYQAVQRLDT